LELRVRPHDEKSHLTKIFPDLEQFVPKLLRHVLSTWQDCAISWNCFPRKPLALDTRVRFSQISRAGAVLERRQN
jgi:hypothetical protein